MVVTNIMNNTKIKKNFNIRNRCYLNGSNISSRSNICNNNDFNCICLSKEGAQDNGNSKNDNTATIQNDKQYGIVSGFDNMQEQESQNVICTHPGAFCSGGQQQQQPSATCSSGLLLVTGIPFTPLAVCIFQNLVFSPPCNIATQTPVMFMNGTVTCLDLLIQSHG